MNNALLQYQQEAKKELQSILRYWMLHTIDNVKGGFYGSIDNKNKKDVNAPKGVVLNARILWTFSAAYNHTKNSEYLNIAERAFNYIVDHFSDKQYGGVYWSVDANGVILDGKKQVYGLAFVIYGMSEYYAATQKQAALDYAVKLYELIEQFSYDKQYDGYYEAFARDWSVMDDLRLSDKDVNEKKTVNTHLHIIEAYANLYKVWPDEKLMQKIIGLLALFNTYFIDSKIFHLKLFFNELWKEKPDVISYGHDIEAAWLLLQCAELSGNTEWIKVFKEHAVNVSNAAFEGIDEDGGLWYEYEPLPNRLVKEKHWWPQAEAMIGFFNAYEITKDNKYLHLSGASWAFVKEYLIDKQQGEWYWGVKDDYTVMPGQDKAGFWKCPYHNVRACIEIDKRADRMLNTKCI